MLIRKVTIENWRGLGRFEAVLGAGVNVLKGPNEVGKSSVVQAIEWGLHRDVVGTRIKDEIDAIIPAHDPSARPTVTLLLEFSDCTATVTKTLAPEAPHRDCRLLIQAAGQADQEFEREEAQARLRTLHGADGLEATTQHALEAGILISPQNEHDGYIHHELSTAVRSTLTLDADGGIAPTGRLERVRNEVRKKRYQEDLKKELEAMAVDAARRHSAAAGLRDQLETLRAQRDDFARLDSEIEALRATIAALAGEVESLKTRAAQAGERWGQARHTHTAQQTANGEVTQRLLDYKSADATRADLHKTVGEIGRLRADEERAARELARAREGREAAVTGRAEAEKTANDAAAQNQEAQARWEAARQNVEAWERCRALCDAKRERKRARQQLERLEALEATLTAARSEFGALPRFPPQEKVREWRERFHTLAGLRQRAAQQLKVDLVLEAPQAIVWRADHSQEHHAQAAPGEKLELRGVLSVTIGLPGVGEIRVSSDNAELHKLVQDIEDQTSALGAALAPFGLSVEQLPGGFTELENRRAAGEAATLKLSAAEAELRRALSEPGFEIGSLAEARKLVQTCEATFQQARAECEPLRHLLPPDVTMEMVNRQQPEVQKAAKTLELQARQARRAWEDAFKAVGDHTARLAGCDAQIASSLDTGQHVTARLAAMTQDGLDDVQRADKLEHLTKAAWAAEARWKEAQQTRAALGAAIGAEDVARFERDKDALLALLQQKESELQERRSELRFKCEQDPPTEIGRLDVEIEEVETELMRHEARLRGIALLEAALEAERHRLGAALAHPLNQRLAPWLSQLRGKPTFVEFDDHGQRITKIRTTETLSDGSERTISLDFDLHSGGLREQIALMMRLIFAQLAAARLPGKRLPVILDDPFTQTDTGRRAGLFEVLADAAQSLQIIFVTCHEDHSSGIPGATIIPLGRLQPAPAAPEPDKPKPAKRSRAKAKKTEANVEEPTLNGHSTPEKAADVLALW